MWLILVIIQYQMSNITAKGDEAEAEAAKLASASMYRKAQMLQEGEGKCILAASLSYTRGVWQKGKRS